MVTGMYSYETYASSKKATSDSSKAPRGNVGYFKLVDDGDEALVRFVYDDAKEIVIAHVHDEPVGNNKHRRVLCLRENARDDMAKCPLCARGDKYFSKVYLKLIEYSKDENGRVVAQAKVWERPASFADTIVEYINNYGGLKDVVFKVKRKGMKGSTDTNYILTPMPSTTYNENNGYVKDFHDFDNFNFYPHSFLSKTKEDMEEYISTGEFPFHKRNDDVETKPNDVEEAPRDELVMPQTNGVTLTATTGYTYAPETREMVNTTTNVVTPASNPTTPTNNGSGNPLMDRPRRRYDV